MTVRRLLKIAIANLLYRTGILSGRRWLRSCGGEVCILGLHRVLSTEEAAQTASLPGIVLRRETFSQLCGYLKRAYHVIPTDEVVAKAAENGDRRPCCAITFDDGWRDNYTNALPILREHGLPATIFVVTELVGSQNTFWIEKLLAAAAGSADVCRRLLERTGANDPEAAVESLKHMSTSDRALQLRDIMGQDPDALPAAPTERMMSWEEARAMQAAGIRFGSHTATHPLLPYEAEERIAQELSSSKTKLGREVTASLPSFAYPNGSYDARVREAVARAGYTLAFTTRGGWYRRQTDPLAVPRFLLSEGHVTGLGGRFSPAVFEFALARSR